MTDPTAMVLTSGLAAVFGLFVVSAVFRALSRGSKPAAGAPAGASSEEGSPYEPPAKVVLPPELPYGKVPVWFYLPMDLAGAALVFLVFGGLVIASLGVQGNDSVSLNPTVLVWNIGFQFVLAGMVSLMVIWRVGWAEWLGLRWPGWRWVFLIAPSSVVFMWVVFGCLQASGYVKWMESLGVDTVQDTVKLLQKSSDPVVLGLMAFAAVIAAPVCEEIVFRGYFYPVLKRFAGAWPAAVCSAFVFAAAHGSLAALLPLFLFGCLLVLIYEKTGSLWAPISVHFCFNAATVLIQAAARHFDFPIDPAP